MRYRSRRHPSSFARQDDQTQTRRRTSHATLHTPPMQTLAILTINGPDSYSRLQHTYVHDEVSTILLAESIEKKLSRREYRSQIELERAYKTKRTKIRHESRFSSMKYRIERFTRYLGDGPRGRLAKYFTLNWKQRNEERIPFHQPLLPSTINSSAKENLR